MKQTRSSQQSPPQWHQARIQVQAPHRRRAGAFLVQGNLTLYTAFSTGRAYDARGAPPCPCVRCNGMHWSFHRCPTWAQPHGPQEATPQPPPPPPPAPASLVFKRVYTPAPS